LGTRPLFTVVLFLFGVCGSFAAAYYRYQARSRSLDHGQPWARAAKGSS